MDQTKRPLMIPPEFATYAEQHGIFDLYKVSDCILNAWWRWTWVPHFSHSLSLSLSCTLRNYLAQLPELVPAFSNKWGNVAIMKHSHPSEPKEGLIWNKSDKMNATAHKAELQQSNYLGIFSRKITGEALTRFLTKNLWYMGDWVVCAPDRIQGSVDAGGELSSSQWNTYNNTNNETKQIMKWLTVGNGQMESSFRMIKDGALLLISSYWC